MENEKKKHFSFIPYIYSFFFFFTFKKSLKSWFINWWNISQFKIFFNDIKEKNILKKFIKLKEVKIHKIEGSVFLRWHVKGISKNMSTKFSYSNI